MLSCLFYFEYCTLFKSKYYRKHKSIGKFKAFMLSIKLVLKALKSRVVIYHLICQLINHNLCLNHSYQMTKLPVLQSKSKAIGHFFQQPCFFGSLFISSVYKTINKKRKQEGKKEYRDKSLYIISGNIQRQIKIRTTAF